MGAQPVSDNFVLTPVTALRWREYALLLSLPSVRAYLLLFNISSEVWCFLHSVLNRCTIAASHLEMEMMSPFTLSSLERMLYSSQIVFSCIYLSSDRLHIFVTVCAHSDVLIGSSSRKSDHPHSVSSDHVIAQSHCLRVGSVNPQFSAACADEQVVVGKTTQNFVGSFVVPKQVILLEIPEVQITELR